MPSSLERVLSSALGSSPHPPVSVCGTVTSDTPAGTFLGSLGSLSLWALGALLFTSRPYRPAVCPTRGPGQTAYWFEPHNPCAGSATLLRPSCVQRVPRWCRNINLLPITYAFRPRLRDRLTLGRLTLPRNPWAYGDRVSRPVYRYSSLHSLFHGLHRSFPYGFVAHRMLAYRCIATSRSFGALLSPVIFSARIHLTSELLRFL